MGERSLRATAAVGPNVARREAIQEAFGSLRFHPFGPTLKEEAVLTTGTASGQPWELVAYRYQWESVAISVRARGDTAFEAAVQIEVVPGVHPEPGSLMWGEFPDPALGPRAPLGEEVVLFGVVPAEADRVEVRWGDGSWKTRTIPLPDAIRIDPTYDVFALVVPRGRRDPVIEAVAGSGPEAVVIAPTETREDAAVNPTCYGSSTRRDWHSWRRR